MKTLALLTAAALTLLSVAGCAQYTGGPFGIGKGKAPPPAAPVVTKTLAKREGCSIRKVNMTISLAFLAPDLVKAARDVCF